MKKFFIRSVCFLAIICVIFYVLNFCIEQGLRNRGTDAWSKIVNSKMDANILIMGNSRAFVHISPTILDSVLQVNSYNMGIDGYPFSMQYVQYKIYETYGNPKPNLIIQNADLFTLYRRKSAFGKNMFLPYTQEPLLKSELKKMEGFSFADFYIPAYKYHSELMTICLGLTEFSGIKHFPGSRIKGYAGQEKDWDGSKLAEQLAGDSLVFITEPDIVQEFDDFLKLCKENNTQVVMVFSPQYHKVTEFTKNKDETFALYHSFSTKYGFPFLDYSADPLCYDTAYFYNGMHLNKTGAEIFSHKLAHAIDSLGILK
jgi:hypothetical protein